MPGISAFTLELEGRAYQDQERLGYDELNKRARTMAQNWRYYDGLHHRHLKDDGTGTDDNIIENLCGRAIDTSVATLMGTTDAGAIKGPSFEVNDGQPRQPGPIMRLQRTFTRQPAAPPPAQAWLDLFWQDNDREIFLHDMAVYGAVTGHVFVKISPADDTDYETPSGVMLSLVDPQYVTVYWDVMDRRRVLCYQITIGVGDKTARQEIVRMEDGGWLVRDMTRQGGKYAVTNQAAWGYPWPPIIDWKNLPAPREYYGLPDLSVAMAVNDQLNFVQSNIQRIIKHHASPRVVITGAQASNLMETNVDSLWTIPSPDASVTMLEIQGDLAASMNFADVLRRAFFSMAREVDMTSLRDKLGQVTNFGLRILYKDALEKVGTKRLLYGAGLRHICQRALELQDMSVEGVNVQWPDPLFTDPLQTAQALTLDRQHGLSQDTYLERRGFDPELETVKRERERAEKAEDQTAAVQGGLLARFRATQARVNQPEQAPMNGSEPTNDRQAQP